MGMSKKRMTNHAMDQADVQAWTDKYFTRTAQIVEAYGDKEVTYAVFIRRPCRMACGLAITWLKNMGHVAIPAHEEGALVGAGDPLFFLQGSFQQLAELETLLLQKVGLPCIAAYNAYDMAMALPETQFLAMDARHCAGLEMAELAAYGVSVGSKAAQANNAKAFIGNSIDAAAHYFGNDSGMGTIPHALIGYAGSTLRAAEMYVETHPNTPLVVLADYYGREVSDALEVCAVLTDKVRRGEVSFRLDTHGGRYLEGLDPQESYAVLERHVPDIVRSHQTPEDRHYMIGTGVSAAAVWAFREALDNAGYPEAKIVASSGFNGDKCRLFAKARVPVDVIGTGSTLPVRWSDAYATADIIAYDGVYSVKQGREYLIKAHQAQNA